MTDPFPQSRWEQRFEKIDRFVPYVALGVAAVISIAAPDQTWGRRLLTLGLTAAALTWLIAAGARRRPGPPRGAREVGGVGGSGGRGGGGGGGLLN
jgi:hypothetical protein